MSKHKIIRGSPTGSPPCRRRSVYLSKPSEPQFFSGTPVDDSATLLKMDEKTQYVKSSHKFTPLLMMGSHVRIERENEVRTILTRLICLLQTSAGGVPVSYLYPHPSFGEYHYTSAGHMLIETSRELKATLGSSQEPYADLVQMAFLVCLDRIGFRSESGKTVYRDNPVSCLVVNRMTILLQGLLLRSNTLVSYTTARIFSAIYLSLVAEYIHY